MKSSTLLAIITLVAGAYAVPIAGEKPVTGDTDLLYLPLIWGGLGLGEGKAVEARNAADGDLTYLPTKAGWLTDYGRAVGEIASRGLGDKKVEAARPPDVDLVYVPRGEGWRTGTSGDEASRPADTDLEFHGGVNSWTLQPEDQ